MAPDNNAPPIIVPAGSEAAQVEPLANILGERPFAYSIRYHQHKAVFSRVAESALANKAAGLPYAEQLLEMVSTLALMQEYASTDAANYDPEFRFGLDDEDFSHLMGVAGSASDSLARLHDHLAAIEKMLPPAAEPEAASEVQPAQEAPAASEELTVAERCLAMHGAITLVESQVDDLFTMLQDLEVTGTEDPAEVPDDVDAGEPAPDDDEVL